MFLYSDGLLVGKANVLGQSEGLLTSRASEDAKGLLEDQMGGLLGNGLNVHATGGRGDKDGSAIRAIHQDRKVGLARDIQCLRNHHLLDLYTGGSRLLGRQLVAEHLSCKRASLLGAAARL